ncbi:lymphocyte antigen 6E-like [Callorhinchus milii]|uniref:lymphocyte antigen 6E-like n=1 Tax=Callorhinchus milii TaxID=7868 RepID=UPI0004574026|nr:lymphocyte antigen 6E-like [Callorhinchus milii]|eukprot:gi/632970379/ref/XP_007901619.1/ PREDICTED: lymphocyte antigen 6E-like [Callorhinchus milii]
MTLLAALVAITCLGQVSSLTCYECFGQSDNKDCLKTISCSSFQKQCQATIVTASFGLIHIFTSISKSCTGMCENSKTNFGLTRMLTYCCSTDLCNVNNSTTIGSNHLVILCLAALVCFLHLSEEV